MGIVNIGGLTSTDVDTQIIANEGGWKDLVNSFSTARGNGTTEPVWTNMGNGIYNMRFTAGDELFTTYHIPHDYKAGTKAYPHIHWICDIGMTVGDTVTWRIQYVQAKGHQQAESLTAATTLFDVVYTADGTEVAGEHIVTECSEAQAFVLGEVDGLVCMGIELFSTTVTGNEKIFGIMADLHYMSDGRDTNEKAPSFTKTGS